jgi:hypothetical protein
MVLRAPEGSGFISVHGAYSDSLVGYRLDAAVFYLTNFGPVAGSMGKREQCGKTEEWGVCLFRALFLGLCFSSRYHAPLWGGFC